MIANKSNQLRALRAPDASVFESLWNSRKYDRSKAAIQAFQLPDLGKFVARSSAPTDAYQGFEFGGFV